MINRKTEINRTDYKKNKTEHRPRNREATSTPHTAKIEFLDERTRTRPCKAPARESAKDRES